MLAALEGRDQGGIPSDRWDALLSKIWGTIGSFSQTPTLAWVCRRLAHQFRPWRVGHPPTTPPSCLRDRYQQWHVGPRSLMTRMMPLCYQPRLEALTVELQQDHWLNRQSAAATFLGLLGQNPSLTRLRAVGQDRAVPPIGQLGVAHQQWRDMDVQSLMHCVEAPRLCDVTLTQVFEVVHRHRT